MALNLPIPNIANSFSGLSDNLMKQLLERQQMQKQQERFAQELALRNKTENRQASQYGQDLALRRQAESRLGQSAGLNRELLKQQIENWKHKNDPGYALKQLQQKLDFIEHLNNMGGGQNQNAGVAAGLQGTQGQEEPQQGLMDFINQGQQYSQGEGALSSENEPETAPMGNPEPQLQQQPQAQPKKTLGGLDMDTIKQALTYQALGLKVPTSSPGAKTPEERQAERDFKEKELKAKEKHWENQQKVENKEPPDLKRANDLKSKMEEAKYKHELKLAEAKQANELKNEQTKKKVVESARNDLPHLEETLRSLKIMQKIAEDPKNDDLFGHWLEGHETAAARSTNPNAGTWQVYGLDPIVAAEMKMSSKGNQLALKSALQNKPNFGENRLSAVAKIKGGIDKIERQIKQTRTISGEGKNGGNEFSNMSDEELRAIVEGG